MYEDSYHLPTVSVIDVHCKSEARKLAVFPFAMKDPTLTTALVNCTNSTYFDGTTI